MSITNQIPREKWEIVARAGGISYCPAAKLAELGLVRLYHDETNVLRLVTTEFFQQLQGWCWHTIRMYRGYISAADLDRLEGVLAGKEIVEYDDLDGIKRRAQGFIEAGLPPLFDRGHYEPAPYTYFAPARGGRGWVQRTLRLFPTTDFLIQFATGIYERRHRGQAVAWERSGKKGRPQFVIMRTFVRDVQDFCQMAFTSDGRIDPLLMTETLAYQEEHFRFRSEERKEEVCENGRLIFLFLEELLSDLRPATPSYVAWDGNLEVMSERRWYLRFDPDIREKMVQTYLDRLPTRLSKKQQGTVSRLRVLFPHLCQGLEDTLTLRRTEEAHAELERRVDHAIASGDFRGMPDRLFTEEPWRSRVLPAAERAFDVACRGLESGALETLFGDASYLHTHIKMPSRLALVPTFKAQLDRVRLEVAQRLPDEKFLELFGGEGGKGRRASIGHAKFGDEVRISAALRSYINARHQAIVHTTDEVL